MEIQNISDTYEYSARYSVILCDLWGVIHNGEKIHKHSQDFLEKVKNDGKKIILISNAPRPNFTVEEQLRNKLGLSSDLYDYVVTSGDITAMQLNKKNTEKNYYHIGPDKDKDLLSIIELSQKKEIYSSDFILCTGINDDLSDPNNGPVESANDYLKILEEIHKLKLEMVCANPDKIVYRGDTKIDCAGAVALKYEKMGGKVKYFGKPHIEIYEHILTELNKDEPEIEKKDLLAIGDSFSTDILGANNFNIDALFIKSGIHHKEINKTNDINVIAKRYLSTLPAKLITSNNL